MSAQTNPDEATVPILSRLAPAEGAVRGKKRVGRGPGSGLGKTCGRGQKGQKARSTGRFGKLHFEGGQMPLQRRLPKVGFWNPFAKQVECINVRSLATFDVGATVTPDLLRQRGLIRKSASLIKILGEGKLEKAVHVKVHALSKSAKSKIEAAGGTAELISEKPSSRKRTSASSAE